MADDISINIGQEKVIAMDALGSDTDVALAMLEQRLSALESEYYGDVTGSRGPGYSRSTQMSPNYKATYVDPSTGATTLGTGWIIKENGDVEFNDGFFRGTIIARAIDIPNSIATNSFHVDENGNSWWGTNTATGYATAPAYILNTGDARFNNVQITGTSTVGGRLATTIGSAINSGGDFINDLINSRLDTSSQEILQDFDFGATNFAGAVKAGTISWNTGTGGSVTGSGVAVYRKGIVGANAGTVTFSINATNGSALFSGELAAANILTGSITMPSGGFIRAGQTAYDTGTGFYLGNDSGTPRLSIGSSSANKMTWDGSTLLIRATTNGGITLRMPVTGGTKTAAGLVVQDSGGTSVLKINNNAFITTLGKSFSAASNTSGTFGSDWFNMFCETDLGNMTGVFELPSTNRMLIKRSGGGAVIRIRATSSQTGIIDTFEPLAFAQHFGFPFSPVGQEGVMYYDTDLSNLVYSNGSGWYSVTSTPL